MRLIEMESAAEDLTGALAKASSDIPALEEKLQGAEAALATADAERQRVQKVFRELNARAVGLLERLKATKLRAMQGEAKSTPDESAWKDYGKLKSERPRVIDSLEFVGIVALPEAERAALVASIAEREAYADLLEGRAVKARLGVLTVAAGAADYDPGMQIDVSGSWSQMAAEEVGRVRGREIPELESQLADLDWRTASHVSLANAALWS
jgi:hypothetical protein